VPQVVHAYNVTAVEDSAPVEECIAVLIKLLAEYICSLRWYQVRLFESANDDRNRRRSNQ
jgi:hypothetical protein